MRVAKYSELPWDHFAGVRASGNGDSSGKQPQGSGFKRLFQGEAGQPGNFEMVVLLTGESSGHHFPRHRHDFDQLRWTLAGSPEWTPGRPTPTGTLVYTPAGTYYGPYDRHAGDEQLHVQFEGANGAPFVHYDMFLQARAELAQKGTFDRGVYSWTDERGQRHNKDAHEAAQEHITGRPVDFPPARFTTQIDIIPDSFTWLELAPGVSFKELGRFGERDTRIAMLKLEGNASYRVTSPEQVALLFVTEGAGEADGTPVEKRDGMMLTKGDQGLISTTGQIEILLLGLPKPAETRSSESSQKGVLTHA
jgi:hypothetical protein